jgi:hypothetical protein
MEMNYTFKPVPPPRLEYSRQSENLDRTSELQSHRIDESHPEITVVASGRSSSHSDSIHISHFAAAER